MFRMQNRVSRARFSTFPTVVVPGPGKVVKIPSKHFSTVLSENDMNCTTNYWVCFGCKLSHPGPVFHFTSSSGLGPEKVVKTQPKQFSATVMTNDKNCT